MILITPLLFGWREFYEFILNWPRRMNTHRPQCIYLTSGRGHHFPIETFNKSPLQPSGNLVRRILIHHHLPASQGLRNSPAGLAKFRLLQCLRGCLLVDAVGKDPVNYRLNSLFLTQDCTKKLNEVDH